MNNLQFLTALFSTFFLTTQISLAKSSKPKRVDPYASIRQADLSKLSQGLQIKFHEKLTHALVELEKNEKYPEYVPSKFSSIDLLKFLQETILSTCTASENSQLCLFGGWPSIRNGSCSRPWSSAAKAASENLGVPGYDSGAYCGDEKLFRCNPLLFGPGIEDGAVTVEFPNVNGMKNNAEPWHSGICVDISDGYNGLSEKCQKASIRLDEIRVTTGRPKWRSTDFFDENKAKSLKALQELVYSKCKENFEKLNQDNMCTSLNDSIALINDRSSSRRNQRNNS